ncbi:hypothetical protein [Microbacterium lacticum]
MENYGRWSLLSAVLFFGIGVYMLVKGVGPEWYSYVSVVAVFTASVAWAARYVIDLRRTRKQAPASGDTDVQS